MTHQVNIATLATPELPKARIDYRTEGTPAKVYFKFECEPIPLTQEMAIEAQETLGYPVKECGFFCFECIEDLPGQYTATWACWGNRDAA